MNTPAHSLIAAAVLARPGQPRLNIAVVAGSLIPDLLIFWMVFWEGQVNGLSEAQIFGEAYWYPHWQDWFGVTNSIPVYALAALAGYLVSNSVLWGFGAAATLHVLADLPLHHDDGHPHFWPFTDWVFESPVSYWDPAHHGLLAGSVEAALAVLCGFLLWHRFRGTLARILIALIVGVEILFAVGSPLMFG